MTPEQIRAAACEAFNADAKWMGLNTAMFVERHLASLDAVFRAGMAAGRAAERRSRGSLADPESAVDMAALLRRLESDPEEAARFLGDIDARIGRGHCKRSK